MTSITSCKCLLHPVNIYFPIVAFWQKALWAASKGLSGHSFPLRSEMSFCDFTYPPDTLCGFVYFRDLKIENLLLDEDNNIKLIGMTFSFS